MLEREEDKRVAHAGGQGLGYIPSDREEESTGEERRRCRGCERDAGKEEECLPWDRTRG